MKTFFTSILLLFFTFSSFSEETKNLAEKLGFGRNTKLLIIHADDLGLSHATNSAVIEAFQKGGISSASLMVTCPWFPEMADYVKKNPQLDIGIHTTLTSEWENYFFGGVLPASEISSLLNPNGYFYPSVEEFASHAKAAEVEKELRAQIERALQFGIKPSHFDNHMGTVLSAPEFYQILLKLGHEYQVPVLIPAEMIAQTSPQLLEQLRKNNTVVDQLFMINQVSPEGQWGAPYLNFIEDMQPGLNEMIVHLAVDNDETRAIMVNHDDFGAQWRQHDLDFVLSAEFQKALKDNHIKVITWKQIRDVLYPDKNKTSK